jgi:hypothetical protein
VQDRQRRRLHAGDGPRLRHRLAHVTLWNESRGTHGFSSHPPSSSPVRRADAPACAEKAGRNYQPAYDIVKTGTEIKPFQYCCEMLTTRQLCSAIAAVDVILFLVASALNDHSNTSVDGVVWWAALALFVVLIAISVAILGRFLWIRHQTRSARRRRSGCHPVRGNSHAPLHLLAESADEIDEVELTKATADRTRGKLLIRC